MRLPVIVKAFCAALVLTGAASVAMAQEGDEAATVGPAESRPALSAADVLNLAPDASRVIRQILVDGVVRVEPNTVLSYLSVRPGDVYDPAAVNMSIETLFATGLFSDVAMTLDDQGTLVVRVEENPIINRVIFEGNNAMDTDDLRDEVEVAPRTVFTEGRVQADAQRIIELYRRSGRFAATVTPTIVELDQNRVDLIFEISEGQVTGVRRVNFIGNEAFSDGRLRGVIATEESRFWRFFSNNTNYDPDRLDYDRELLREFYNDQGYAEFRVVSAVAELTPDQRGFYVTFTVEEGAQFTYGDIAVETELEALDAEFLRSVSGLRAGDDFVGSDVENAIDTMTYLAGTAGYAFVDIRPELQTDASDNTVDITFHVSEGPRVYIERIDILGNTQTLDRVIRREMMLVEGDAYNRVLLDRSRNRIRVLDFFEEVEIEEVEGTRPDTTIVQVNVTEQSTGELSFGAGYSSLESFLVDVSVTQRNLRGRGQYLRVGVSTSSFRTVVDLRFQEPRFLDRNLSAGFDAFHIETDYGQEAGFQSTTTGAGVRFGFPISDTSSLGVRYTLRNDGVDPYLGASEQIRAAAGDFLTSLVGYTFRWDRRNDPIAPTRGWDVSFSQDFAGVGGDVQYIRSDLSGTIYRGIIPDVVASFTADTGYVMGWGGDDVRLQDRYFKGGFTFRGFETAGIGPRVVRTTTLPDGSVVYDSLDALGGKFFAIGALEVSFPLFLPEQYGIRGGVFTEFGTLGGLDASSKQVCSERLSTEACQDLIDAGFAVEDELALRASAGVTVFWDSPFGPVRFDFSKVLEKQPYDRTETFRFSQTTRF